MSSSRPYLPFALGVWCAAAMSACTTPADPVAVASVQLQPGLDSITPGETYSSWIVTLRDAAGNTLTGRPLTWSSSRPEIGTIDATNGAVTGIAVGTTLITVASGGKTAQAGINVIPPVMSIVVTPDSFDLPLTTTRQIVPQLVGPAGLAITGRQITWSSSDPGIATVSTTGVVTPFALGTATISAFSGGKEARVRVRVRPEPVASVRIAPVGSVHVVRLGQGRQLTAECLNVNQQVLTGRVITWTSSNPLVASVGDGLVTGVSIGQANITATCDNLVSASVVAQVTPVPVSSVTITPPTLNLQVGQQGQLTATARDSANNVLSLQGRTVTWTSDNLPVATVSPLGVVAAVSAGVARIQVSVDGVLSQIVDANVTNVPVASVTIGPLNPSVVCGQQIQLTATTRDANSNILTGRSVSWISGTQAIATIGSATGIATGVAPGTTQITATSEGVSGFIVLTVTAPQVGSCP